eukprot:COSAG02_NODE_200_length_29507_cov_440.183487_10_plen_588_part_00
MHSDTLTDVQTADIVSNLISQYLDPTSTFESCPDCLPGSTDADDDPTTPCGPCAVGRFSAEIGLAGVCAGTCPTGQSLTVTGATDSSHCNECAPGTFEDAGVCTPCPIGSFSVASGASGPDSCTSCPDGQSSVAGAVSCSAAGCTDPYATNYDANAIVDLGSCEYTCSSLRAAAQVQPGLPGSCVIYDSANGSWKRYDSNDLETGDAAFRIGSTRNGPLQYGQEHWIIQGRPLAGSTVDAGLYPPYAVGTSGERTSGLQTGNSRVHVRYTDISSSTPTTATSNSGCAVRMQADMCTMPDGAGGVSCFTVFDHVNFADSTCDYGGSTGIYGADQQSDLEPTVSMSYVTYSGNVASRNGGAIRTGGGVQVYSNCAFNGNEAIQEKGGAIYVAHEQSAVVASFTSTSFSNNVAPEGGAIYMVGDCSVTFTSVSFNFNKGRANGGSICVMESAYLETTDVTFTGDTAAGLGRHIYANAARLLIQDTVFSPYDDGGLGVYLADTAAGCEATPCAAGESCGYNNFSLTCTQCPQFTYSADGITCGICAPGSAPRADRTTCEACAADEYSQYGTMCQKAICGKYTGCITTGLSS